MADAPLVDQRESRQVAGLYGRHYVLNISDPTDYVRVWVVRKDLPLSLELCTLRLVPHTVRDSYHGLFGLYKLYQHRQQTAERHLADDPCH